MADGNRAERYRWYATALARELGAAGDPEPVGEAMNRFRVTLDGEPATVEVAELVSRPPDAGRTRETVRAYRAGIARAAREAWLSTSERPHVEAWIAFGEYEQSTAGRDRTEIGERVAALVAAHLPAEGTTTAVLPSMDDDVSFPLGLASVTVARYPTFTDSYWRGGDAPPVPDLDADALQDAVSTPEAAADGRRLRLLVAGGPGIVSVDVPEVAGDLDPGGFDGVHLLDPGTGSVRRLVGD